MAKGIPTFFKIPEPRGLNAKVPRQFVEHRLLEKKPLPDKNQFPPTPDYPERQHYRMAGGCK